MSRGGRGGGRGGRGGGRGNRPMVPWDNGELDPDSRPSELFPPRVLDLPRPLTETESSTVKHFLLLRHQIHASPLYTARRTALTDPLRPRKAYGAAQANARYAAKNRATQDPFTAVGSYSQRFVREERALPDWSRRPISRELWPKELLDTVDAAAGNGSGGGSGRGRVTKKRRLELSSVSALPNAERAFGLEDDGEYEEGEEGDGGRGRSALERLDALGDDEGEDVAAEDEDGEEMAVEDEDEVYDDEDAGDYNAEVYFDNGDELGDDYGDEGDGEGTF